MTTDAQKARNVDRILTRVGMQMTLTRASGSAPTYDPSTGVGTPVAPASYTVRGCRPYPYALAEIDGTHVQRGDMRVLLSTVGSVMPKPGDTLTIGATVYRVMSATSIAPATVDIVYDVQVRAP